MPSGKHRSSNSDSRNEDSTPLIQKPEEYIKMNLREIVCKFVDRLQAAQDYCEHGYKTAAFMKRWDFVSG
jgi:hypothetical protein